MPPLAHDHSGFAFALPPPPPLNVRVELVLVDGPDGKRLRQLQAAAIREALRWFAEHPQQPADLDSHPTDES